MNTIKLPFVTIQLHKHNTAELIVEEGVELTAKMVAEFYDVIVDNLKPPFSLLINKVNAYSFDYEAQQRFGSLELVGSIAVVYYTQVAKISANILVLMNASLRGRVKTFDNREAAFEWLPDNKQYEELDEKRHAEITCDDRAKVLSCQ